MWRGPLDDVADGGLASPRIGIGGISIESSTFSPHVSGDEAFIERREAELLDYYPFLAAGSELRNAADWVPILQARSLPGGAVARQTYERLKAELLDGIRRKAPFDGFYFDIHGAMSVVGLTDAEGDLATAVREELGPDVLIGTSMDLHGNVSRVLLDATDLITCYRMAPHEDDWNTKERAVHTLLSRLRAATGSDSVLRRPFKAWLPVPVLLPGEKTSTRIEPARTLYAELPRVERRDGVTDAALWVGYAWADEPRCQAAVVVTGDAPDVIRDEAERLGRLYWDARADFAFVAPAVPLDEAIESALASVAASGERPYLISDSGDNPTAGGAGDVSWTLGQLLRRPEFADGEIDVVHASVFDSAAVATAVAAGVGASVRLDVGGRVDDGPSGPVSLVGEVLTITHGDPDAGSQVVVKSGGVHAIITERRKPFHHVSDFTDLGIDPRSVDILIVKIGYLEPELYELATGSAAGERWRLALTPGGVDQDLVRLGHSRLVPGVYPFEPSAHEPDLRAIVSRRTGHAIEEI
ncbi:M81 family metallopeptidase [Mycetocola sp.]|uniref:M81 family metallopeptidase n=1 Tax=Mycetocola sp. TaxID=1871042 RepID=UPI0039896934